MRCINPLYVAYANYKVICRFYMILINYLPILYTIDKVSIDFMKDS